MKCRPCRQASKLPGKHRKHECSGQIVKVRCGCDCRKALPELGLDTP